MPERDPSEYSPEDLEAVKQFINTPVNQVERQPFKPWVMIALLMGSVIVLGGLSLLIGWLVEPYL